jgi:hypothetical protein
MKYSRIIALFLFLLSLVIFYILLIDNQIEGYTTKDSSSNIFLDSSVNLYDKTKYDSNNYDVEYHNQPSISNSDESTAGQGKMWVLDKSNNLISVPYSDISTNTLYNEPGSFRFGSSNYVPNYEETVYLSKLTNLPSFTPVKEVSNNGIGFCEYHKNNPDELEKKCNEQNGNTCGSLNCCVLLGGEKCVYGNENGPFFKSNYSNFLIKNTDYYYYQGKCYGNCK